MPEPTVLACPVAGRCSCARQASLPTCTADGTYEPVRRSASQRARV
jgi:hypothetical protein